MAGKSHSPVLTLPTLTTLLVYFLLCDGKSHGKSDASRFRRHLKRTHQAKFRQWEGERSAEQEDEDHQEEQESLWCTADEDMDEDIWEKDKREDDSVEEEDKDEEEEDKDEEEEKNDEEEEENDEKEEDMDEEEENKDEAEEEEEEEDELIGGEEVFRSDEEDIELTKMDAWSQAEDKPAYVLDKSRRYELWIQDHWRKWWQGQILHWVTFMDSVPTSFPLSSCTGIFFM